MPSSDKLTPRGYLLLAGVIVGWGVAWPMIKIGLTEIPPWTYRGLMSPLAGLMVFAIARAVGSPMTVPRALWPALLLAALFNITAWNILSVLGLRLMGSGHASILAYTLPLWAFVFSTIVLHERPTAQRILGLAFGLAGIVILISGEFGILATAPLGTLFMLLSAVSWGAGTVVQKRALATVSPVALAGWQLFLGGLPMTVVAVLIEFPSLHPVSAAAWWSSLFVLLWPTIFCWFAWFSVVQAVPVTVSTIAIMLVPLVAVIGGNLLLGEAVGWREVAALACVAAAIALVLLPDRNPRPKGVPR